MFDFPAVSVRAFAGRIGNPKEAFWLLIVGLDSIFKKFRQYCVMLLRNLACGVTQHLVW